MWRAGLSSAPRQAGSKPEKKSPAKTTPDPNSGSAAAPPRRLKYKEKLELQQLPEQIDQLETEIADIHRTLADPGFYQQGGDLIASKQKQLKSLEQELENHYQRWEQLEELNQ